MKKFIVGILLALSLTTAAYAGATVKVLWTNPTQNTDGSPYIEPKGVVIYCGLQPLQYSMSFPVNSATATSVQIVIPANQGERWYFAATAVDLSNNESAYSTEVNKYFTTPGDINVPNPPTGLQIKVVVAP